MELLTLLYVGVLYLPMKFVSTMIHELGHYTVFRLYGIAPQWVDVGTGKLMFKFRIRGTWFHFKRQPYGGEVAFSPGHLKKMGVWGALLMFAAGPLFQTGFALALIAVPHWVTSVYYIHTAFWILGGVVIFNASSQLYPLQIVRERNGKKEDLRTDGFQILNCWKRRHQFKIKNTNW